MNNSTESEVTRFYRWIYNEVKNNDMAKLGPIRFIKEHKTQTIVPPDQFLPKIAKMMYETTGKNMSLEDVAADFNDLIENGDISKWVTYTNKKIATDYIENVEKAKEIRNDK